MSAIDDYGCNVTILHETEIEIANGRRIAVTALRDDDGARTVVAIESRTGRTVQWIEIDGAYALRPMDVEGTDDERD